MGSLYMDFLNQITTPVTNENDEVLQLICECSRGELKFDTLSTQKFTSTNNCPPRGICAFIAKNKHMAKISRNHSEIVKKFEERVKNRTNPKKITKQRKKIAFEKEEIIDLKPKSKSLLGYI